MTKPAANLSVAVSDSFVCIKIAGRANFTASIDFKKLVHELIQRGHGHFVLDLSECMIMDSTFLGVLAGIGLGFVGRNGEGRGVKLLNPNERIRDLLDNLGVSHLFQILEAPPQGSDADFSPVKVKPEETSRVEITRNCLEAHQLLMSLNPENAGKFKDCAAFLAEDLKKMETKAP